MNLVYRVIPYVLYTGNICFGSDLMTKLKDFELGAISEHRIVKRSIFDHSTARRIKLDTEKRSYDLILKPSLDVIHPQFRFVVENDERQESIDETNLLFYGDEIDTLDDHNGLPMHGYLYDDERSLVRLSIDEHGAVHGRIETLNDTYFLEPLWRHVQTLDKRTTLVYKETDLIKDDNATVKNVCPIAYAPGMSPERLSAPPTHTRVKREAAHLKTRCSLKLVADYHFYEKIANKNRGNAARYLLSLIDRVNAIYEPTNFTNDDSHWGFMVRSIVIKESFTKKKDHWNSNKRMWDVNWLLSNFTVKEYSKEYCLVHLFTAQSFQGGVLGLGYIGSSNLGTQGGICSAPNHRGVYYNTALSTLLSTAGDPVLTSEADGVTAHELGHNWGSTHDESGPECSPRSRDGGSYLMHTYSVSGFDPNNKKFSPCSIRAIGQVLNAKSHICFEEEQTTFCGNGRVEIDRYTGFREECDAGLINDDTENTCCSKNCTLKPNAKCSPLNSQCCNDKCYLTPSKRCRQRSVYECHDDSFCNARGECPPPKPLPDGTPCVNGGECQDGVCKTFCEKKNISKLPCMCQDPLESCFRCCRDTDSSPCLPYNKGDSRHQLKAGTRCVHGYCDKSGVCKKELVDVITYLFNILDTIQPNNFWQFFKQNLVGMTVIFSLILWIPCCIFIRLSDIAEYNRQQNKLKSMQPRDYLKASYAGDMVRISDPLIDCVDNNNTQETKV